MYFSIDSANAFLFVLGFELHHKYIQDLSVCVLTCCVSDGRLWGIAADGSKDFFSLI